jgi:pimeloyl-ACP methyl ester carboxylesterase
MSRRIVPSRDGTRIAVWTNEGLGVPIVLCNGLGTPVTAWPRIIHDTGAYRVVSWDHRGLGQSDRPADETRITVEDHADDLLATMDAFDMDRAVVIGWSVGVNVAFEVARRDPARVAAVMAVAGVPGGSFSALFPSMPRVLRPSAGRASAYLLRYAGPLVATLSAGLPASSDGHVDLHGPSTGGLETMQLPTLLSVLHAFSKHDWVWYSQLANAQADHEPMDLGFVDFPVTFIGSTWDSICSAVDVREASRRVTRSRYVELAGSHYVPLQMPSVMKEELDLLIDRAAFSPIG